MLSHVAELKSWAIERLIIMIHDYPIFKIGDGVYEINEFGGPSMFFVEGSEGALLIDTGVGIGDLRFFVEKLFPGRISLFLTHNHRDHVGNAPLFDSAKISQKDYLIGPIVRDWTSRESRLSFAHNVCASSGWSDADMFSFCEKDEPVIEFVEDCADLDLGNRTISFYDCPGHTAGSMVAIDSRTGILFCGDSCNNVLGVTIRTYPGIPGIPIETALKSLKRIWALDFDRNKIFNGHPDFRGAGNPLSPSVWTDVMNGMERILANDYVCRNQFIGNVGTEVDAAVFDEVQIQFHSDCIFEEGRK